MSNPDRLVSYDTLKIIVQYFDPNFRLHLTLRYPSFKKLHPTVPLQIDDLHLGGTRFLVNNTVYKIGIIRHYTEGTPPEWARKQNEGGGVEYDFGEFRDTRNQRFTVQELWTDEDAPAEYTHYIKLTSTYNRQQRTLGVAKYDRPRKLALEYLAQKFFPEEIRAKNVRLEKNGGDFLLNQRTLRVDRMTLRDFTGVLLDTATYKVNTLESFFGAINSQNPLIRSAKVLILNQSVDDLLKLQNENVQFNNCQDLNFEEVKILIQNWIYKGYPIGRHYRVKLVNSDRAKILMNSVKGMDGAIVTDLRKNRLTLFPHCIAFPMTATSELDVYYSTGQDEYHLPVHYLHFGINRKGYFRQIESDYFPSLPMEMNLE